MNLSDLARHANAGRIDALELISLEGGIYILDIYLQASDTRWSTSAAAFAICARSSTRATCCATFPSCHSIWCSSPLMTRCAAWRTAFASRCAYPSACVRSGETRQGVC